MPIVGHDSESNLAFLDVEHGVSRVPLREDCLFPGKGHDFPTLADGGKELLRVEVPSYRARSGLWPQRFLRTAELHSPEFSQDRHQEICSLLHTLLDPVLTDGISRAEVWIQGDAAF